MKIIVAVVEENLDDPKWTSAYSLGNFCETLKKEVTIDVSVNNPENLPTALDLLLCKMAQNQGFSIMQTGAFVNRLSLSFQLRHFSHWRSGFLRKFQSPVFCDGEPWVSITIISLDPELRVRDAERNQVPIKTLYGNRLSVVQKGRTTNLQIGLGSRGLRLTNGLRGAEMLSNALNERRLPPAKQA